MNTRDDYRVLTIGQENTPLIVWDDFFPSPEALVDEAAKGAQFQANRTDYYPGLRKLTESSYANWALAKVSQAVRREYQLESTCVGRMNLCAFSLTTTKVHELRPIQCVPHVDTQDARQFALIHYLCGASYGGTAFYRHKSTGYETISAARVNQYFPQLQRELASGGMSLAGYMRGDNCYFEKIGAVDVRFNRALLYPGNLLHSGLIDPQRGLSEDPRQGRLTANSFIQFLHSVA